MVSESLHGANHYENFPVASWLVPKTIRPDVLALYRLARLSDDLADEGTLNSTQRQAGLAAIRRRLTTGETSGSASTDQACQDLLKALARHGVSPDWMLRLLSAFDYDAQHRPFEDWSAVYAYCQCSANPVGRMMLGFLGLTHEDQQAIDPDKRLLLASADAVCTGLQLVNFAQDFGQDLARGRPTLPRCDWPTDEPDQWRRLAPAQRAELVMRLVERGERCLVQGEPLLSLVKARLAPGLRFRMGLELETTRLGGLAMARLVRNRPLDCWESGPRLGLWDFVRLIGLALLRYSRST